MKIIARIQCDFKEKFGIPRQSGLVRGTRAAIVFEPEYRNADALRGIDGFSHLWLIWAFSKAERDTWSPTVRPPRLGGNTRMGVFATRAPYRPNAIGLSCVELIEVKPHTENGPVLIVGGADLLDGTPIYDIKPYLPHADCHPEATGGFAQEKTDYALRVIFPEEYRLRLPEASRGVVAELLAQDPRPSYQSDPDRVYGMVYGKYNIRFTVSGEELTVCGIDM